MRALVGVLLEGVAIWLAVFEILKKPNSQKTAFLEKAAIVWTLLFFGATFYLSLTIPMLG